MSRSAALLIAICILVALGAFGAYLIGVPRWLILAGLVTILGLIGHRVLRTARRASVHKETKA